MARLLAVFLVAREHRQADGSLALAVRRCRFDVSDGVLVGTCLASALSHDSPAQMSHIIKMAPS